MSMGLDPLRTIRGVGIDQYKAGLGEYLGAVASDAWANGPLSQIGRLAQASDAQLTAEERGETLLSAKDASDEGRELGLRFEAPIARGAFNVLAEEKRRQAAAEGVFQRARLEDGYGTVHWLMAGGTEFLSQAADPLNLASAFIPVVSQARGALIAARIGGFGAAVAKGAVEGAVGQALLEPLNYADRRSQGGDYGMLDTLTNLAFGAGLGVALHGAAYGAGAGFRFIRERFTERAPELTPPAGALTERPVAVDAPAFDRATDPPPRQPVAEAMETLRPETKDAAMRAAVAQLVQDKPVDIEPLLASDPSWPQVKVAIEELQAHETLQAETTRSTPLPAWEPPADFAPTREELAQARRAVRGLDPEVPLPTPERLSDFVRRIGGLTEGTPEAGDLLTAEPKQRGLIRKKGEGRQVDHLALSAQEAGFRVGETREGSGADVQAFMEALIEDAGGTRPHFAQTDHTEAWRAQQQFFDQYKQHLKEGLGLDPKGMDPRQLAWLLRQDETTGRLLALVAQIDRLGDNASLELAMRLEDERMRLQQEIAREPGADVEATAVDHREVPPATLEELERYHAEFERAAVEGEPRQEAAGRGAAAGRAGEGGEADPARPAGRDPAPEGAGLRREGEGADGATGAAGDVAASPESRPSPDELARFAERQQSADLHADPAALDLRDERLAGESRETAQLLADDLRDYGHLLDDDTRLLFDESGRIFDSEVKAIDALAACQLGGA